MQLKNAMADLARRSELSLSVTKEEDSVVVNKGGSPFYLLTVYPPSTPGRAPSVMINFGAGVHQHCGSVAEATEVVTVDYRDELRFALKPQIIKSPASAKPA